MQERDSARDCVVNVLVVVLATGIGAATSVAAALVGALGVVILAQVFE